MQDVYQRYGKRFKDLILLFPALAITALPMMVLGVLVRIFVGSPVFFRQQRPGLCGKPFTIYKFRTMTESRQAEKGVFDAGDLSRLTLVGKLLTIQHRLNPLHLHCRFLDRGLNKKLSTSLCRSYEIIIFFWLNCVIKSVIYFYCFVNRKSRIYEELRKK